MENIKITLPDGSTRNYVKPITILDIAKDISEGLARNVISAQFNEKTVEVSTVIKNDGNLILYTWKDPNGKKAFWHSSSHVLAQALQELYPGVKLTIGPAIENGFYYDVDLGENFISEKDLKNIEDRMLQIAREKHDFKICILMCQPMNQNQNDFSNQKKHPTTNKNQNKRCQKK